MRKTISKRTVYASLYTIPDEHKLKAHMIFIVGKNGKIEDYIPGPFTMGDWFGSRLRKPQASKVVLSYLKDDHPHMKIAPEDVKLYPYKKANELLFKLQNR